MYIFQPARYLLQESMKAVSPFVKGKVLDAGAGSLDRYSGTFQKEEYIRMEPSPGKGIDVVASIYSIPFAEGSFDSVLSSQVFEHLNEPQQAAYELARVLKRGGHAIITIPQASPLHEMPNDFFRYTSYGLEHIFKKAGFEVTKSIKIGGYFSLRAQMFTNYTIDRFHLHSHPYLGRVASKLLFWYGKYAIRRDEKDTSQANHINAIGWCYVFQKK